MKYYFLYKTVNKKDGKFYLGCHVANNINDNYLGSGLKLLIAIKKHGKENFERKILAFFSNREEMLAAEKELITEQVLNDKNCYNLNTGGYGSWHHVNGDVKFKKFCVKKAGITIRRKIKSDKEFRKKFCNAISCGLNKTYENGWKGGFYGKNHTDEFKKKVGKINSVHQRGKGNSQYGMMWITNQVESTRIKKTDVIPNGWMKGRVIPARG